MAQTYDLNCERCGATFTSNQPDARFCSNLCCALVGSERRKYSSVQRFDNPCTVKVTLLGEVEELIHNRRKRA